MYSNVGYRGWYVLYIAMYVLQMGLDMEESTRNLVITEIWFLYLLLSTKYVQKMQKHTQVTKEYTTEVKIQQTLELGTLEQCNI